MSRFIPRGVAVAGLGRRTVAALIDAAPVVLIVGVWLLLHQFVATTTVSFVSGIVAAVLLAGYGLYQWWAYGSRAAGLGAKAMGLQLVGINSGQPIGWWRYFVRQLVFFGLILSVVGGIALLLFTVIHDRRQGWHDMAARSLMVQPKRQTAAAGTGATKRRSGGATQVGLPPHLSSAFAPGATTQEDYSTWAPQEPATARPDWMPQIQAEPIIDEQPRPSAPSAPPAAPVLPPASAASGPSHTSGPSHSLPPRAGPGRPVPQSAPFPAASPQRSQSSLPPQSAPFQASSQGSQSSLPPQSTPSGPPVQPYSQPTAPMSAPEPPAPTPKVRQRQFGEVPDDDGGTRLVKIDDGTEASGQAPNDGWYLRLDDGREVGLSVTVLLGRNPQKEFQDGDVHLVPAGGDGRMISRTHVEVGIDARGVYVMDRGSTNGTAIVQPSGGLQPCPVGTRVRVSPGQQVSYGDRWFTLLRRS